MRAHRIYWLRSKLDPALISKIGAGMLADGYAPGRSWGFQVEKIRFAEIVGSYIERQEYEDQVIDPLGETLNFSRVVFRRVRFRLSTESPEVELLDPPSNFRSLLSQIALYTNFELVLNPLSVNLKNWHSVLSSKIYGLKIVSMELANIHIDDSAVASIRISGHTDMETTVSKICDRNQSGTLERLGVEWRAGGVLTRAELHREGRAWAKTESAIEPIRASLQAVLTHENASLQAAFNGR